MRRCVVVTGAAGGIAGAALPMLVEDGFDLLLVDRPGAPASDAMASARAEAEARGQSVAIVESALDSVAACDAVLDRASAPPYAMVHLAGVFEPDATLGREHETWDRAIAHNLTNAYDLSTAFTERMDEGDTARIVFVSSLAFRWGGADHVGYSSAKGGLVGLTRALAKRLGPRALVNALAPGIITTRMPAQVIAMRGEQLLERIPLGRFGAPEEVAGVIRFLLSDAASYITGQCFNIDGGLVCS